MNEGNNETGTQEKKGTFVDNDDSLEALPTMGNGIEIDEIPPVPEAPYITE